MENSLPTRTGLLKQQRQCRTMMTMMMMQHARSSSFVPYNGNNISNNTRADANAYILNNDSSSGNKRHTFASSASSIDTRSEEEEQTRFNSASESRNDH